MNKEGIGSTKLSAFLLICLLILSVACTKKAGTDSDIKVPEVKKMLVDSVIVGDDDEHISEFYGFYRVEAARTDSNYRHMVFKAAPLWIGGCPQIKEYRIESDPRSVFSNNLDASLPLSWEHTKVDFKPFSRKYPERIRNFWVFDEKGGTVIDSVEWNRNGLKKLPDGWYSLQISDNMTDQWRGWFITLESLKEDLPLHENPYPYEVTGYTKSIYIFTFLQLPKMDTITANDLAKYERRFTEIRKQRMKR